MFWSELSRLKSDEHRTNLKVVWPPTFLVDHRRRCYRDSPAIRLVSDIVGKECKIILFKSARICFTPDFKFACKVGF